MPLHLMLPVPTYPQPIARAGMGPAIDLAAQVASRLSIVVQHVDIPPIVSVFAEALIDVAAMSEAAEQHSREVGAALARDIAALAAERSLSTSISKLVATPVQFTDLMVGSSRVHDATLLVIDPGEASHVDLSEAILFGSGGPILICPSIDRDAEAQLRSVMVAWDGSRAAARAVRDALPILSIADTVTILTASEDKTIESSSVDGLRALLEHHGIESGYREVRLNGQPVGRSLQEEAANTGAGLLVMGGFGHSRIRELVLGGATASVLRHGALLPIFMSH
jgi:nucleotide-binding universal stress UspA family protein